jgi:hypothetical protein
MSDASCQFSGIACGLVSVSYCLCGRLLLKDFDNSACFSVR